MLQKFCWNTLGIIRIDEAVARVTSVTTNKIGISIAYKYARKLDHGQASSNFKMYFDSNPQFIAHPSETFCPIWHALMSGNSLDSQNRGTFEIYEKLIRL